MVRLGEPAQISMTNLVFACLGCSIGAKYLESESRRVNEAVSLAGGRGFVTSAGARSREMGNPAFKPSQHAFVIPHADNVPMAKRNGELP